MTHAIDPDLITDLRRLAAEATRAGIRIYHDRSGRSYATSRSQTWTLRYVTAASCDCPVFAVRGRCAHNALLLETLGFLSDPEPTPPAVGAAVPPERPTMVSCLPCLGTGRNRRFGADAHSVAAELLVCPACGGSGSTLARDDEDRFAADEPAPDAWLDDRFEIACDEDLAA